VPAWSIERTDDRLALVGEFRFDDVSAIWRRLRELAQSPARALDLDLSEATTIDSSVMALVVEFRASLIAQGIRCEILGGSEELRKMIRLYRGDQPVPRPLLRPRLDLISRVGVGAQRLGKRGHALISFAGELAGSLRRPLTLNLKSLPVLLSRAGADGVPIVLVLNFLIGFVMAYQSAEPLEMYGADVYVADIVSISVTRELAPLITAAIMAGRSGAAYAAELGTMRVSEEIDALRTLGFSPMSYLVVPRIIALATVAPMLTLLGDVVGVLGGITVGKTSLGVTPSAFIAEMRTALVLSDVWTGLVKSFFFGIAIAFIGCQQGLTTTGAASGVGRGTTATVVQCLFMIVIIDTVFTMIFRGLGL
jgi:phospholipid/cholesterol/gamma-HCH transport system permease protein